MPRRVSRRQRLVPPGATSDATDGLIWTVARGCMVFVDLQCLSFALVVLKLSGAGNYPWSVAFLPMFCASLSVVCLEATVFLRAASLKLRKEGPTSRPQRRYGALRNERNVVREDALPLLRRGLVATVASVPAVILVFAAQILAYRGATTSSPRKKRRFFSSSLGCLLSLETVALLLAVALKGRSSRQVPASQINCSLTDVEARQLAERDDDDDGDGNWVTMKRPSGLLSATYHFLLWLWLLLLLTGFNFAFIPFWFALLLFARALVCVTLGHCRGKYKLTTIQLLGVSLYACATVSLALAAQNTLRGNNDAPFATTTTTTTMARPEKKNTVLMRAAAALTALFSSGLGLQLAFYTHARQLSRTRGHGPPQPLTTTRDGFWAVDGSGESFWFLLGSFERALPSNRHTTEQQEENKSLIVDDSSTTDPPGEQQQQQAPTSLTGDIGSQ